MDGDGSILAASRGGESGMHDFCPVLMDPTEPLVPRLPRQQRAGPGLHRPVWDLVYSIHALCV